MQQHARAQSSRPSEPSGSSDLSANLGPEATHSLFAYPLESNFSGARYGLQPITQLQQHGAELHPGQSGQPGQPKSRERWHIFLDAAKACGSSPPDLKTASADFVVGTAPRKTMMLTGRWATPVMNQEIRVWAEERALTATV